MARKRFFNAPPCVLLCSIRVGTSRKAKKRRSFIFPRHFLLFYFLKLSFKDTERLNTGFPGAESTLSTQK